MEQFVWRGGHRRVLVALSGGADSVALTCLLRELPDGPELLAAHFEHGIRGEASREDAAFVRTMCAEWGIPLVEEACDVPALARARGVGLEQAARDARYAFLRRAARAHDCDGICLAHHLDDQAETVLMHLMRGSGLRGLRGMAEEEDGLIRPLLRIRKGELIEYLRARGIPWREDATNQLPDNPRNALRLEVMPRMLAIYPGAQQAISRLSRIARVEDDCLSLQASEFVARSVRRLPIGWQVRETAHPAILGRAIRLLMPLEAEETERVLALYARGGRLQLSGGRGAEATGGRLYLLSGQAPPTFEQPLENEADLGEMGRVHMTAWEGGPIRDDPFTQAMSARAVEGAVLRNRRPGDFIIPLGMTGRQKLSDYLINRRVDRPLRDLTVLLARGSEILWAAGIGLSETARLREGERAVRIAYDNQWN